MTGAARSGHEEVHHGPGEDSRRIGNPNRTTGTIARSSRSTRPDEDHMTDPIAEWFSSVPPRIHRALRNTIRSPKALVAGLLVVGGVVALALTFWDTAAPADQLGATTIAACPDPDAKGRTPEITVKLLVSAATQGDFETYSRLLGGGSSVETKLSLAYHDISAAYRLRFPWAPSPFFNGWSIPDEIKRRYTECSFDVKGIRKIERDRVLLTIQKSRHGRKWEETWLAVLEHDEWRIILPGFGMVEGEERQDQLDERVLGYERFTKNNPTLIREQELETAFYNRLAREISAGRLNCFVYVWVILEIRKILADIERVYFQSYVTPGPTGTPYHG